MNAAATNLIASVVAQVPSPVEIRHANTSRRDGGSSWVTVFIVFGVIVVALRFIKSRDRSAIGPARPCASCGQALPALAKFCSRCGKRV